MLLGCDTAMHESGVVTDATTHQPIAGAQVWFADKLMDQGLAAYLDHKLASPGPPATSTDAKGAFSVDERLTGPNDHEIWIVVRAPDHTELRRRVWKGVGTTYPEKPLAIALEPTP